MSTITISFQTKALDFAPLTRGRVLVVYNDGTNDHLLDLELTTGIDTTGKFKEVAWVSGQETLKDNEQAKNFAKSFNRDYAFVGVVLTGGMVASNLDATVSGNVVTITAKKGTFDGVASNYNGNVLVVGSFATNNVPVVPDVSFSSIATSVGNCNTIDYDIAATGGVGPYSLNINGSNAESDWDGTTVTHSLNRGALNSVLVTDSEGRTSSRSINVPRKLTIGEFSVQLTQNTDSSDILVQNTNPVSGTTPLEYAITDISDVTGSGYQSSNAFPGIFPGQYQLWVKDKFGCEVSKIIEVPEFVNANQNDYPLYFEFPEGQTLIASEFVEFGPNVGKNYFNTNSFNQLVDVRHPMKQFFVSGDVLGAQFKSSYKYHYITLYKCDGSKVNIPSVMIQENINVAQKLDCVLFPINEKTGVYFSGGNEYEPNTSTVIGASEYNKTTPSWNNIGQLVTIEGIGSFPIESSGYDSVRGGYFVLDFTVANEQPAKIQAIYNAQDYNLWEFYINSDLVGAKGTIVIEKALADDGNVEGNPYIIENITIVSYNENMLHFEWSDPKNRGGIVFQSGITFKKRCFGEMNPIWDNEADTFTADQEEYSVKQTSFMGYEILVEGINLREVTQLNIASGLKGFKCNQLLLTRKKPPEPKRLGKSNLYSWKCEFGYGQNNLALKQDEIVYNVATGTVASNGSNPLPDLSGIQLYKDENGNIITFGSKIAKI